MRTRASVADRLRSRARGAGRRRGAHGGGPRRRRKAAARDVAHGGLLRDADPAAGARQGALCRRAGRRRHRREPLSRRGRARTDRDRLRAAAVRHRSGRRRARGAPLLHEEAGTNVLVAREFKRGDVDAAMRRGAGARSKAASACAARPRWRSSRARCLAEYEPAATR